MVTNPSWNLANADVVRLRNARDIIISIIPLWSTDSRYSGQLSNLETLQYLLESVAQQVQDYLAVAGT